MNEEKTNGKRKRRKANLERMADLAQLLDAGSDGILILNKKGSILFSNSAAARLLNKRKSELKGWLFGAPVVLGDKTEVQVLKGKEARIVEMQVSRIKWDGDEATVACLRDITEHVSLKRYLAERNLTLEQANQELKAARDAAVELARLKSEFAATVSHEIRTPMSGIIGLAELLASDERLAPDQQELASQVHICARRMLDLVKDLLDFSKLEAGRCSLVSNCFRPADLVLEIREAIRRPAQAKKLKVITVVDESLPAMVVGDDMKIRQTLLNLAHNAVKFTSQGFVKIEARLLGRGDSRLVHDQGDSDGPGDEASLAAEPPGEIVTVPYETATVEFIVEDTGIGIDSEDQKRVFEPFLQLDGSTRRRFEGIGLGLAIAARFVHLMGGTLKIESVPNQGARFFFALTLDVCQPRHLDVVERRSRSAPA